MDGRGTTGTDREHEKDQRFAHGEARWQRARQTGTGAKEAFS
jgi:hypothetical protein